MSEGVMRKEMVNRLRTIKGHIQGVEKMVEEGKNCQDILIQLTAIKSSVEKVGLMLVENHARDCLLKEKNSSEEIEEVIKSIIKFLK